MTTESPAAALPRILCVDDEKNILASLERQLRRDFVVDVAESGESGLAMIADAPQPYTVITTDYRMARMDGLAFLEACRERTPDSIRILLTGKADLQVALDAINNGCIFRLLEKPCPSVAVRSAVRAGVEQFELVATERVLLEQTLKGSIRLLTDVLALANPAAFGRGRRIKNDVLDLAGACGERADWRLEVSAMLSQIAAITLPHETAERLYRGEELSAEEREMCRRMPEIAGKLLANIPRLEDVRRTLNYQRKHFDGSGQPADDIAGQDIPWPSRALRITIDFDQLITAGNTPEGALEQMRDDRGVYDPELLEAFAAARSGRSQDCQIREVNLRGLEPGMVFGADVRTPSGVLLIAHGQEVTQSTIERLLNLKLTCGLQPTFRVLDKCEQLESAS